MRRTLLLVGALCLGGCDFVFGLDDPSLPKCAPKQFANETPQAVLLNVDAFSFDREHDFAVVESNGQAFETTAPTLANPGLVAIPLDPAYIMASIAMEPRGKYFFFTAAIEPFQVLGARRDDAEGWVYEPKVPKGFIAGTPSDAMSGEPVRVVVRLTPAKRRETDLDFTEYEQQADGTWKEVNERFSIKAIGGANLSQDGRVIVYDGDEGGVRGVYVRQRESLDDAFRSPELVFEGVHLHPQLFEDCRLLYTLDEGTGEFAVTKYEI